MRVVYKIGDIVGVNSSLLVLEFIPKNELCNRPLYKVQCQICKNDSELHGEAIYYVPSEYLDSVKGKLPCGCSRVPKWSKGQWEVIIKRKAKENSHEFIGFIGDKVTQATKLSLKCNVCGNHWSSCSINNYMKDRTCPVCANKSRASKRSTSDEDWITRFRNTGLFPTDTYSFKRVTETGREWEVHCSKCNSISISDRSNLVAGKAPCNCSKGGGYDISKTGYFYILKVAALGSTFLKFGISNFPKRRISSHVRKLNEIGGTILEKRVFKGEGSIVLKIESELKRTLSIDNKFIDGFRREACSMECLALIEDKLGNLDEILEVTPV